MMTATTATLPWTADEIMTVAAARRLADYPFCFVGIGLPSLAAILAQRTAAPDLDIIYESGALGTRPSVLPLSIGDGEIAEAADVVVAVPEVFNYWLQPGRIPVGFLGAAQIDRFANVNTTVIGPYDDPTVRLPGAGGAPEIACAVGEVVLVVKHERRKFVDELDFLTTPGHLSADRDRAQAGLRGAGPQLVITDLGLLVPASDTGELVLTHLHPGTDLATVRERTGWPLRVSADLRETTPPADDELAALRALQAGAAT